MTRPEDHRDPEADAEFDRELAKMMAESANEPRKTDRKPVLDIPLPMRRVPQRDAGLPVDGEIPEPDENTVQFSLLSKKGNRPQVKIFGLPLSMPMFNLYRPERLISLPILPLL